MVVHANKNYDGQTDDKKAGKLDASESEMVEQ
jgi:hypothetical protein